LKNAINQAPNCRLCTIPPHYYDELRPSENSGTSVHITAFT
jgi:hypothetical protein